MVPLLSSGVASELAKHVVITCCIWRNTTAHKTSCTETYYGESHLCAVGTHGKSS